MINPALSTPILTNRPTLRLKTTLMLHTVQEEEAQTITACSDVRTLKILGHVDVNRAQVQGRKDL